MRASLTVTLTVTLTLSLSLSLSLSRTIVVPAICLPAALLAFRAGLVVDDPLVRLLLMIMPAMPSSQTFVSIVQARARLG